MLHLLLCRSFQLCYLQAHPELQAAEPDPPALLRETLNPEEVSRNVNALLSLRRLPALGPLGAGVGAGLCSAALHDIIAQHIAQEMLAWCIFAWSIFVWCIFAWSTFFMVHFFSQFTFRWWIFCTMHFCTICFCMTHFFACFIFAQRILCTVHFCMAHPCTVHLCTAHFSIMSRTGFPCTDFAPGELPTVLCIHCTAHQQNLFLQAAFTALPLLLSVLHFVQPLFAWPFPAHSCTQHIFAQSILHGPPRVALSHGILHSTFCTASSTALPFTAFPRTMFNSQPISTACFCTAFAPGATGGG